MTEKKTISELKNSYIISGVEELIEAIRVKMENYSHYEDIMTYYLDTKQEGMEENHLMILEESSHLDIKEDYSATLEELKNLNPKPKPMFVEATFRSDEINSLTIPDEIEFEVIEIGFSNSYRFEIDDETIYWLAETLGTEAYYLLEYDRITIEGS